MIATQITASTQVSSMEIKQTKKIFLVTGMTPSMLGTKKSDRTFVVLVVSLQRHHFSSFFGVLSHKLLQECERSHFYSH